MTGDGTRDDRGDASRSGFEGDLSERLKRLGSDLAATRHDASPASSEPAPSRSDTSAIGQAFRLSAEFVAGVVAGGIVGWLVDRLVGSAPWGLIVFVILGFCAGMLNLLRASGTLKPARSDRTRT